MNNKQEYIAQSIYLSPQKILMVQDKLASDVYPSEYTKALEYFKSEKSDIDVLSNQRYLNGISFVKEMLNTLQNSSDCFSNRDLVQEFIRIQSSK